VLLHRVARVFRANPDLRGVVIVPTEGLVRLLAPLLAKLGADLEVTTYDRFANKQARRAFRRLPPESESTPPSVMRMKRSPALRRALTELAARPPGVVDDDRDARVRKTKAHVSRGDLQHLFGDRVLLEDVARAGKLPKLAIDDTLDRTRVQFAATAERAFRHVTEKRRLRAVDGRALDEGTASEHATTVDVEDYAVLFELDRLRAERDDAKATAPSTYDLVAIDEAQELAPLELALIGRSVAPGGTLVVAGDADQQTDETADFAGWEAVMRELGAEDHATTTLDIGYRCPPEVVGLARAIRGGEIARGRVRAFANEPALARAIGEAAAELLRRDRRAAVAILTRHPLPARRLATLLHGIVPARLVFDGRFLPRGPVQITIGSEVKGLEFDYVVVADADARTWPDDAAARRALYVAVTRARHQALLVCAGAPTPIVAAVSDHSPDDARFD
jgi:hypothetical protein